MCAPAAPSQRARGGRGARCRPLPSTALQRPAPCAKHCGRAAPARQRTSSSSSSPSLMPQALGEAWVHWLPQPATTNSLSLHGCIGAVYSSPSDTRRRGGCSACGGGGTLPHLLLWCGGGNKGVGSGCDAASGRVMGLGFRVVVAACDGHHGAVPPPPTPHLCPVVGGGEGPVQGLPPGWWGGVGGCVEG